MKNALVLLFQSLSPYLHPSKVVCRHGRFLGYFGFRRFKRRRGPPEGSAGAAIARVVWQRQGQGGVVVAQWWRQRGRRVLCNYVSIPEAACQQWWLGRNVKVCFPDTSSICWRRRCIGKRYRGGRGRGSSNIFAERCEWIRCCRHESTAFVVHYCCRLGAARCRHNVRQGATNLLRLGCFTGFKKLVLEDAERYGTIPPALVNSRGGSSTPSVCPLGSVASFTSFMLTCAIPILMTRHRNSRDLVPKLLH